MSAPTISQLMVSHWQAAPALDVEGAAAAALYLWGAARVRGRWPLKRTAAFLAGVLVILAALQSGLDTFDDIRLSAHMIQHLLLLLVAPLLLLWGRPVMLALRALPASGRRSLARIMLRTFPLGHWVTGLVVFYLAVIGLNVPSILEATVHHPLLHDAEHMAYLTAGLIFLWPVFGHPAGRHSLGSVGSLCYVIASMPSCALVGSYLNRYTSALYPSYVHADRAWGISALIDQQYAGVYMWVGAHLILTGVALWVLGSKLVAEERRQKVRDALEARAGAYSGGDPTVLR